MTTFRIFYRHTGPLFDGSLNEIDRFNRHQLREALASLRFLAHTVAWRDVAWVLKLDRKTIATIHPPIHH